VHSCTIWLNAVPPSLNRREHHGHWAKFAAVKGQWERDLGLLMLAEKRTWPKGLLAVHATAILSFPVARRRDEGNFRWLLEKALGDALHEGGWIADDTPEYFTFGEVTFDRGPHKTTVILREREVGS
jgi:hypothetical protein